MSDASEEALKAIDSYSRDYAAWEASKPKTKWWETLREIGERLADIGVVGGAEFELIEGCWKSMTAEFEHMTRRPPSGTPRSIPDGETFSIETACGTLRFSLTAKDKRP